VARLALTADRAAPRSGGASRCDLAWFLFAAA
jgi:hypothetical protein